MDFSFPETAAKSGGGGGGGDDILQGHGDHSPTKLIDISDDSEKVLGHQHHKSDGSGSTDDFEHVYHDEEPLTAGKSNPLSSVAAGGGEVADIMEELLGTAKTNSKTAVPEAFHTIQNSTTGLMHSLESHLDNKINETIDFMNAERGGGSTGVTTQPISIPSDSYSDALTSLQQQQAPNPVPSHHESDYQKEHYNPSPIKKSLKKEDDEKFISSEDLLSDFKDERMSTPEHKPSSLAASIGTKIESPAIENPLHHSGIEDLTIDNDKISVTLKEDDGLGSKDETKTKTVTIIKPTITTVEEMVKKPSESIIADKTKITTKPASKQMISAEEMFYRFGLDTWFKPESLHPKVESLIYWRDVKKSGIVFGAGLIILLAISCFSVISVFAYLSLLLLICTISFRIYKTVMGAVQKTSEGHPFKEYLEMDLNLPHEKVQQIVNVSVAHVNGFVSELRRLFLVEDFVDSIKFSVILWVLTYVGAWFNGMTLVILAFVSLFTLPKVYENNKQSIDTYLDLVRTKILEITDKVKAAVPIGKKPETDKDK